MNYFTAYLVFAGIWWALGLGIVLAAMIHERKKSGAFTVDLINGLPLSYKITIYLFALIIGPFFWPQLVADTFMKDMSAIRNERF